MGLKVGDSIVVNKPGDPIDKWEMIVTQIHNDYIVVENGYGGTEVLNLNQFTKTENQLETVFGSVKMIVPKKKDSGTSQPLYVVIEQTEDSVSFYDDWGYKRTLPISKVSAVTQDDTFKIIQQLSSTVNNLKQQVVEMTSIISADFKAIGDNVKHL